MSETYYAEPTRPGAVIGPEANGDDGRPRGGCEHVEKGMCQSCTFDWMVDEVSRLRARAERLRAVLASRCCNCGPKHETRPAEHREDCEYLAALADAAEAARRT